MINLYNQVPSIYNSASRDFQYLSWLINIVLNSVKHNVDDLYDLPNTKADPRLTELLAMTLGFKVRRNYDQKQLATLVSIIPSILKYKGSLKAITLAGNALLRASGAIGSFECTVEDNCLIVVLPKDLIDTTLFTDLLPYILPAGLTCRIIRKTQLRKDLDKLELDYQDNLLAEWYSDLAWDEASRDITGLAGLYDVNSNEPSFTNFKNNSDDPLKLNAGLLDNTIIPAVTSPVLSLKATEDSDFLVKPNRYGNSISMDKYSTKENKYGTTVLIGEEDNS